MGSYLKVGSNLCTSYTTMRNAYWYWKLTTCSRLHSLQRPVFWKVEACLLLLDLLCLRHWHALFRSGCCRLQRPRGSWAAEHRQPPLELVLGVCQTGQLLADLVNFVKSSSRRNIWYGPPVARRSCRRRIRSTKLGSRSPGLARTRYSTTSKVQQPLR